MKNEGEKKLCPRCGDEFYCSTSGHCWCYAYDLPADLLEKIEYTYNGCLCEKCLVTLTESAKETQSGIL